MSQIPPPIPPIPPSGVPPYSPPPPPRPGYRQFRIISAMFMAPFSRELWYDVGHHWRGINFWYIFLLLLITWLLTFIKLTLSYPDFIAQNVSPLVDQVPPITITNGTVYADVEQPYTIKDPKTGQPILVIDTTGQTTSPPGNESALLTKHKLIIKSKTETRTMDLSGVRSVQVNQNRINGWLRTIKSLILPVIFPFTLLGSLAFRLILMVILGAIGLGIASLFNAKLSFAATMRLTAIAMTPGIWLSTLEVLVPIPLGCLGCWIGLALLITYLFLTIRANGEPGGPTVQGPYNYTAQ